jgi:hypothetical protein
MPAITSGHPSVSALAAFALGKLDAPAAETVHNHLAGCPDCRTVVETTPSDTLVGLLKKAAARPGDTASLVASVMKGTLSVPNSDFDVAALPAELRDHPRYRILRKLGEGGMGAVYQAEHRMMERVVAIKVIAANLVDSPEAIERFQREVRAAAKLEHANIVRAYDADQAGGAMLLAMEFVKGRTLAEVIAAKGPLPVAYACQCVRQAALGLQHAADHGMVHRDIKPQNLMLTEKGVVKILDFGLAKLVSERLSRPGLTGKDMVMGTPEYMAPEQARDTASADIRADIYALGCTLYFLLTGRPPFGGATAIELITKHVMDAPPRVTDLRPEAPAALADLIGRMLAKDPAERPQMPREVAKALAPFAKPTAAVTGIGDRGPSITGVTESSESRTPPRRRLWFATAAGVAIVAVIAAAVVLLKTPDGYVEIDVPDNYEVRVNGATVTVKQPGSGPIQVKVNKDKKTVTVLKDEVEVESKELTLNDKGKMVRIGWIADADDDAPPAPDKGDANPNPGRLDPRGKWKGWVAGTFAKSTIWTDDDGWHFRCTNARTSNLRHVYVGAITVVDGTIEDVTPILPKGYAGGHVTRSDDKKKLTIDIATKGAGREAGFDFKVSRGASRLDFDLKKAAQGIHIGVNGTHPQASTFSLPIGDPPPAIAPSSTRTPGGAGDGFQPGNVWKGSSEQVEDGINKRLFPVTLTILSRDGTKFSARVDTDIGSGRRIVREIIGTVEGGAVRILGTDSKATWLDKDHNVIREDQEGKADWDGEASEDRLELRAKWNGNGKSYSVVAKLQLEKK